MTFDFLVMVNINVGLRVHVIPVEAMRRAVYVHSDGEKFAVRFGVTDDLGRKDVGLLCNGRKYNAAWHLVDQQALVSQIVVAAVSSNEKV